MDSKVGINELCRLCLSKEKVKIHIFEGGYKEEIFLKISTCLPVNISYEDKLPKRICTICSKKLNVLYEFCNKSAESEKQLLDWFNQYGTGNETSKDGNLDSEMEQCGGGSEIEVKEEVISFLNDEDDNYNIKIEKVDVDNYDIQQQENEMPYKESSDPIELDTVTNNAVEVKQENDCESGGSTATNHLQTEINSRFTKMKMKRVYGKWSSQDMTNALKEYKSGKIGLNACCSKYNIPKATFKRHWLGQVKRGEIDTSSNNKRSVNGRGNALSAETEEDLVKYILMFQECLFGLTIGDVRQLAYDIVVANPHLPNRFNKNTKMAGRKWYYSFLSRHPNLSLRQTENISNARSKSFNKENVNGFFDILEKLVDDHNLDGSHIYNVDVSGFSTDLKNSPNNILTQKGKHQSGHLSSGEMETTIVCCCNASGSYVPPMIIFKRQEMDSALRNGAFRGSLVEVSESGYINSNLFSKWFRHFLDYVKPAHENKIVLLLDGHTTHSKNLEVMNLARDNDILLFQLPGHTIHRLQPLEVGVFKSMESHYSQVMDNRLRMSAGQKVTEYEVTQLLTEAYVKSANIDNAMNGFRATGVWPVDRRVFSEADFVANIN